MQTYALLTAVQPVDPSYEGLTLAMVVDNIPTEPIAIFTYVLLVLTYGVIFWVGRGPSEPRSGASA